MKWIRLWVDDILDGTTFTELTMEQRGVWLCLLAMAGRGRRPGIIEAHQGDPWELPALASFLKCSVELLSSTIKKLTDVNKIATEPDNTIIIKNWGKYQKKQRQIKFDNGTFSVYKEEEEEKETPYSPSFLLFWQAYPRRVGKGSAYGAWRKLGPDAVLTQKILATVKLQKHSEQWKGNDGKYIPYPATWLNQRRWEDELESEKKTW